MDDHQKKAFGYLEDSHLNVGFPQILISEGEKRKSMSRVKNKLKRKASDIDSTVVDVKTKMNDFSSTTCPVCSKFFHSKNALFGHMRAHPERQWRGIQPPSSSPLIKVKKNSSSSSTVSDSLIMNVDDQIDSASTSGRLGSDVLKSVSKWPGTLKRRRNLAISDNRVLDAIDGLMMLVNGDSMESEDMNEWKKLMMVHHRNGGDLRSGFVPDLMKMDCGDQICVAGINSSSNGFKCDTCNKSFSSYQALGGHKSRNCRNISCPNLSKADQDLQEFNERQSKDVDKHKCKVCGKTFPTGQALGGHQRSQWVSSTNEAVQAQVISSNALPQMHNVETPTGSVASVEDPGKTKNIKQLDFDLNELPMDYDEECLSQLVPPVFGLTV